MNERSFEEEFRVAKVSVPQAAEAEAPPGWQLIGSQTKSEPALQAGRQRLLLGARTCFATKGYGGTAVSEIAAAAGVSVGSLYKYVRSKEDLLWLLAEEAHRMTQAAIDEAVRGEADPLAALLAGIDAMIRVSDDNADLMGVFHSEFRYMPDACKRRVQEQDANLVDQIAELIRTGVAAGRLACRDPHFVAVAIEMMATTWILKRRLLGLGLDEYIAAQQGVARVLLGAW